MIRKLILSFVALAGLCSVASADPQFQGTALSALQARVTAAQATANGALQTKNSLQELQPYAANARFNLGFGAMVGAVADFNGTTGTDNTAALAQAETTGRCIYIPAGKYFFASTPPTATSVPLCIIGDGEEQTVLVFGTGATDGIVSAPTIYSQASVFKGFTIATLGNETGSAIKVSYPDADVSAYPYTERGVIENVAARGYISMATGWNVGFDFFNSQWLHASNFNVTGRRTLDANGNQTAVGDQHMLAGFRFTNGAVPSGVGFLRDFQIYEAQYGILAASGTNQAANDNIQGLNLDQFNIVEVGTGVSYVNQSDGPGLAACNGHMNVFSVGVLATHAPDSVLCALLIYKNPFSTTDTVPFLFTNSPFSSITGTVLKNQTSNGAPYKSDGTGGSGGFIGSRWINSPYGTVDMQVERPSIGTDLQGSTTQVTGTVKIFGTLINGNTVQTSDTSTGQNLIKGAPYVASFRSAGAQSPGSGYASAVSTGLFPVLAGQRYRVRASTAMTNGSTAGEALTTVYQPGSTGTATYTFDAPNTAQLVFRGPANANETVGQTVQGVLTVTASGMLQLDVLPQLTGSTGSMAAGGATITVEAY